MKRLFLAGVAGLLALTAAAPTPSPAPAAVPAAAAKAKPLAPFSAAGTLNLGGESSGKTMTFHTDMRVLHRDTRWRIDVSNVTANASDPNANSMMAAFLPKGTISLLIDPGKKLITMWSTMHPLYFQTKMALPTSKTKTTHASGSPFDLNGLSSLTQYDVMNDTFSLTGHQTLNGRMASLFHFTSQTQKHGGKLEDVSGDLALADDLAGVPIHLALTAKGGLNGTMAIDLTSVSSGAPAANMFAPPAKYKKTTQPFEVLH
jgi:hypothetical protein